MSRAITESLAGSVKNTLGLLDALIDVLPENLWERKAGSWPIWQHLVHVISGSDLFVPGPRIQPPEGLIAEVIQLKALGTKAPSKAEVKEYHSKAAAKVKGFLASMEDSKLTDPNADLAKIGLNWNMATTIMVLASHASYHLGYGDFLLRSEGLAGVF